MKKLMLFLCLAVSYLAASSQSFSPSKTTVNSGEEFTISGVGESNTAYFSGTVTVMPTGWTSTPDPYAINYVSLVSQTVMNLYNAPIGGAPTSIKVKFTNTSPTNDYTVTFNLKTNVSAFPGNTTLNVLKPVTVTIKRFIPPTTTYYSVAKSQIFYKNNCPAGSSSSTPYTFTVAANAYTSTISQADANAKAQAYIDANGQNAANTAGTCTPNAPVPKVSGASKICRDGDVPYWVTDLPPGVTVVSWSTAFAVGISGSNTGSTVLVHYIVTTPYQHSKGQITALLSNGQSISKIILFKEDPFCQ
jgi:hypothetical protein